MSAGDLILDVSASVYKNEISKLEGYVKTLSTYAQDYVDMKSLIDKVLADGDNTQSLKDTIDENAQRVEETKQECDNTITQLNTILDTMGNVRSDVETITTEAKNVAQKVFE